MRFQSLVVATITVAVVLCGLTVLRDDAEREARAAAGLTDQQELNHLIWQISQIR